MGLVVGGGLLCSSGCDLDGALVPQDTPPLAHKYQKLARGWLTWVMEQPYSTGPVTDPSGDACANEQSGLVWFLAGTDGGPAERTCEIPRGKALFFPLVNRWIVAPAEFVPTPEDEAELLEFAEGWFAANREATCELHLRLDGEPYLETLQEHDEALYVVELDPFEVDLDDDNFTGGAFGGGPAPFSVTDGHFALLTPLSPGDHTLEFGGAICDGEEIFFETSATYHLSVLED